MNKPYNTQNKITQTNSMFNILPYGYEFKSLDHQKHIYETEYILNLEIPNNKGLDESILDYENKEYCENNGIIKRKTLTDVFLYLYAIDKGTKE